MALYIENNFIYSFIYMAGINTLILVVFDWIVHLQVKIHKLCITNVLNVYRENTSIYLYGIKHTYHC